MNAKIAKKLSEQFAAMGVLMDEISGTFRSAGDGGEDTAGNGSAGTKVRPGTKAKPAARGKKAADPDEVSEDDVREALQALAEAKGKGALVAALASVDCGALKEVDEGRYAELIETANDMAASDDEYDEDGEVVEAKTTKKPAGKAAAKGKAAPAAPKGRAKKATRESATEKFTELVEADVDAAKALLKEWGVKKFTALDDDSDWAEVTAQIDEAAEGEGSLV